MCLFEATEHDRDDWVSAIRQAKAQILVSLNVRNPNSTLTSSTSANHVRRSLQALPFPLSDNGGGDAGGGRKRRGKGNLQDSHDKMERRAGVEHWVPAIWIPDEKTKECMRCGQPFGWRRRRHHCRLCGRCVCASCSEKVKTILCACCSRFLTNAKCG
jgi:FYVE, RhoGEF and PH domain containing 5/6